MIIVFCTQCWKAVAPKGINREQAEWAREDHAAEHLEATEDNPDPYAWW